MAIQIAKQSAAVFLKDLRSEFRTRYAISAISLFIIVTITMVLISTANEKLSVDLSAGLLWIIMFFAAMTGLSKTFVSEEERGTGLFLKLSAPPSAIYFGKLLYNIILSLSLNTLAAILFILLSGTVEIKNFSIFLSIHILGSIGIAAASTIISAIIARASTKGAIFPVLSFPILLPLIILGIETTRFSFEAVPFDRAANNIVMLIAYSGVVISASYILFNLVWEE